MNRAILLAWLAFGWGSMAAFCQEMKYPISAVMAPDGSLFVADLHLPGIWLVKEGRATLWFEASKKYRTPLNAVRCLAWDHGGKLLAGDTATSTVYRFEDREPKPLTDGGLWTPMDVAVDSRGNIFVSDLATHRIWQLPQGVGPPKSFVQLRAPRGLAVDRQDNLWIIAHGENQIWRASPNGEVVPVVSGRPFQFPNDVAVDEKGVAYVSDTYASAIWKVSGSEKPTALLAGAPLSRPVSIVWAGGKLIVSDPWAKNVFEVTVAGVAKVLIKFEN